MKTDENPVKKIYRKFIFKSSMPWKPKRHIHGKH